MGARGEIVILLIGLFSLADLEVYGASLKHMPIKFDGHAHIDRQDYEKYKDVVGQITDYVLQGPGKGASYQKLAWLVDTYGARLAGTDALENAIDGVVSKMTAESLDNVHTEEASVSSWRPLAYRLSLLSPRSINMSILPLWPSINTPPEGLAAYVVVVRNFSELDQRANEVKGKIVVYNQDWVSYGVSVQYRGYGAMRAAQYGAVGALVRSVTPLSIYSPHTGMQHYDDSGKVPKIPVASITVEDAELLQRLAAGRSDTVQLQMFIQTEDNGNRVSHNTVAELTGRSKPNQTVLVSGHLDSWYVGVGAMDDGGGAIISWEALSILKNLNLRPARTIRTVLWTAEEQGGWGADQYYKAHLAEIPNMDLVMESDIGTFRPFGLYFSGTPAARAVMQQVVNLLAPLNATQLIDQDDSTDISEWESQGVPGASLANANDRYFYFHHSAGDTLTVENSDELDLCAAVWASVAYIVADLDNMLPRDSRSTHQKLL